MFLAHGDLKNEQKALHLIATHKSICLGGFRCIADKGTATCLFEIPPLNSYFNYTMNLSTVMFFCTVYHLTF